MTTQSWSLCSKVSPPPATCCMQGVLPAGACNVTGTALWASAVTAMAQVLPAVSTQEARGAPNFPATFANLGAVSEDSTWCRVGAVGSPSNQLCICPSTSAQSESHSATLVLLSYVTSKLSLVQEQESEVFIRESGCVYREVLPLKRLQLMTMTNIGCCRETSAYFMRRQGMKGGINVNVGLEIRWKRGLSGTCHVCGHFYKVSLIWKAKL